jgi:hypothetical protein
MINIKTNVLFELCVINYATSNDLVNGIYGIFKKSMIDDDKTII